MKCDQCGAELGGQPLIWGERRFCNVSCLQGYVWGGGDSGVEVPVPEPLPPGPDWPTWRRRT